MDTRRIVTFILCMVGQYSLIANAQTVTFQAVNDVTEGIDNYFILSVSTDTNVGSETTVTFTVDMTDTTAIAGYDYEGSGTYTCTIADSTMTGSVSVSITDDELFENSEFVSMVLMDAESLTINPSGQTQKFFLSAGSGDTGLVQVNFVSETYEVDEDGTSVTIQVDYTDMNGNPTVINGAGSIGTLIFFPNEATSDTATGAMASDGVEYDYDNTAMTVNLLSDESTSMSFSVAIIDDALAEATEYFAVSLSNFNTFAELGSLRGETTVRIKDNDLVDFICLSVTPEFGKKSNKDIVFYAVSNDASVVGAVGLSKTGFPQRLVTDSMLNDGSSDYAKKLTIDTPKQKNIRFGDYSLKSGDHVCTVFSRAGNKKLNYYTSASLDHTYTIIVYPSAADAMLLESSVTFGATYTLPVRKRKELVWKKDGIRIRRQIVPTLTVTDSADAGLYEIARHKRGRRGFFVIIKLILAACAKGKYKDGSGDCVNDCPTCLNGGTCDQNTGLCVCPSCFEGPSCELVESTTGTFGQADRYLCTTFGLNSACKGALFSYDDGLGSTCGCGWEGSTCTTQCAALTFGGDCTETCHCDSGVTCNFRTGVCPGACASGYEGENCQIPTA